MLKKFKTRIIKVLEHMLGREIARRIPARGSDVFADIDQLYGNGNIQVVFDIGANVGQSSVQYRKTFSSAKIYAFEPVSETFRKLAANLSALNDVEMYNIGLGSKDSDERISVVADSRMNSVLHRQGAEFETIKIRTLDGFVAENEVEFIDFLKTDTEGYELEVLKGASGLLRQHRIGMIYVETELMSTSEIFVPLEDLNRFLNGFGYRVLGIYEQQPHWSGEHHIRFCNVLFAAPGLVSADVTQTTYPGVSGRFRKIPG